MTDEQARALLEVLEALEMSKPNIEPRDRWARLAPKLKAMLIPSSPPLPPVDNRVDPSVFEEVVVAFTREWGPDQTGELWYFAEDLRRLIRMAASLFVSYVPQSPTSGFDDLSESSHVEKGPEKPSSE